MSRNYGLSNVTSRPALGAQPLTGSHLREELTRNSISLHDPRGVISERYPRDIEMLGRQPRNSIQLPDNPTSRQANSGRGNAAPFSLDVRELAAAVLVGIVATFAVGLPCVCFVLYYAFFE